MCVRTYVVAAVRRFYHDTTKVEAALTEVTEEGGGEETDALSAYLLSRSPTVSPGALRWLAARARCGLTVLQFAELDQ